jgi:hypothetical protein
MHEPAACGALPAQQAKVHNDRVARVARGKLLDKSASKSVAARIIFVDDRGVPRSEHWIR